MRYETKQKLDRLLWRRRLLVVGAVVACLALAAGGFWLEGVDATVVKRLVPGVVEKVGPYQGPGMKAAQEGLSVDVKLDDGRVAHVLAKKSSEPHVGDHVEIAEHVHGTGRSTFSWK